MYSHCFRVGRLGNSSSYAGLQSLLDKVWVVDRVLSEPQCFAERCKKEARRNSGRISRTSGVISHTPA